MNSRVNRSINKAPKDVNIHNQREVVLFMRQTREKEKIRVRKSEIRVGDFVRVSKNKKEGMDKGYLPNWSDEIYRVFKIQSTTEYPLYYIEDYELNKISGGFYIHEIQKISKTEETLYRVDKILKRRTRKGVREVFVSWKNFSKAHDSWIPETDLVGET